MTLSREVVVTVLVAIVKALAVPVAVSAVPELLNVKVGCAEPVKVDVRDAPTKTRFAFPVKAGVATNLSATPVNVPGVEALKPVKTSGVVLGANEVWFPFVEKES